jgi:hypothetical protein
VNALAEAQTARAQATGEGQECAPEGCGAAFLREPAVWVVPRQQHLLLQEDYECRSSRPSLWRTLLIA